MKHPRLEHLQRDDSTCYARFPNGYSECAGVGVPYSRGRKAKSIVNVLGLGASLPPLLWGLQTLLTAFLRAYFRAITTNPTARKCNGQDQLRNLLVEDRIALLSELLVYRVRGIPPTNIIFC